MRRHVGLGFGSALGVLLLSGCAPNWSSGLVTVNAAGTASGNGTSGDVYDGNWGFDFEYSLSADGTKLAFFSRANDLVTDDTNPEPDIFVRDLTTGTTELVSVDASGAPVPQEASLRPVISADGTRVLFFSVAQLAVNDRNSRWDLYVRDLTAGTTTLVSVNAAGTDGAGAALSSDDTPAFSPDGTKVAFVADATDLGPVDTAVCPIPPRPGAPLSSPCVDVYLRDLTTGTTTLISGNATRTDTLEGHSQGPVFSPDGNAVAYQSTNRLPGQGNPSTLQVYRRDLTSGALDLVSVNASGTGSANGHSYDPMYSPDGDLVFRSTAWDLVVSDGEQGQWYVRDADGTTTSSLVPGVGTGGEPPSFNADGTVVAFSSDGNDIAPGDIQGFSDVFVYDRTEGTLTLASRLPDGGMTDSHSSRAVLDPAGTKVAFTSSARNLSPEVPACEVDAYPSPQICFQQVYVRDLEEGTTSRVSSGPDGEAGDGWDSMSGGPTFLPDGRVLYASRAGNLSEVPDTNDTWDIFLATPE